MDGTLAERYLIKSLDRNESGARRLGPQDASGSAMRLAPFPHAGPFCLPLTL